MSPLTHRVNRPFVVAALALSAVICLTGARKGAIRKLTYDADAPVVKLFDGVEQGTLAVRVAPRDEFSSRVYIANTTDKPQTVELPEAVVGVHVVQQVGLPQLPGNFGPGLGTGLQQGSGQQIGGNLQPGGQQGFPFSSGNTGFFSIPPESTVQLQFNSVCLSYGQPAPRSRMTYVLFPAEEKIDSPALRQLLAGYHPRRIHRNIMQAAAWHLAGDMSWKELASRKVLSVGLRARPLFSRQQLEAAHGLVVSAEKIASESGAANVSSENRVADKR